MILAADDVIPGILFTVDSRTNADVSFKGLAFKVLKVSLPFVRSKLLEGVFRNTIIVYDLRDCKLARLPDDWMDHDDDAMPPVAVPSSEGIGAEDYNRPYHPEEVEYNGEKPGEEPHDEEDKTA